MSGFSALAPEYALLLVGLLFLAAMSELAFCLYVLVSFGKWRRCADGAAIFLLLLFLLAVFANGQTGSGEPYLSIALPWILIPAGAFLVFFHAFFRIAQEYKRRKNSLSPSSVKEALDNLNTGILFADGSGEAVLVNHAMKRIAYTLTGRYPRTREELEAALSDPPPGSGVEKLDPSLALYRFPRGRVWQFRTEPLQNPGFTGFTQTTARDLTEIYATNAALEKENAALRASNEELRELYLHVGERVKEQELLDMKIRIHDDIGTGLIALTEMMRNGNESDLDAQIEKLYGALRYFSGPRVPKRETWAAVCAQAKEMNVNLERFGAMPESAAAVRLIALAAGECVTNCVKHANGNEVRVHISRSEGRCTVAFTNNGKNPAGAVREGVGLSVLRKTVENAGGTMTVHSAPAFKLVIEWTEEEMEKK